MYDCFQEMQSDEWNEVGICLYTDYFFYKPFPILLNQRLYA